MKRILFVRNSLERDDLFTGVEEYIRNYRGPDSDDTYTREVSFSSLRYRFPFREDTHTWKLINDLSTPSDNLTIINKEDDNFTYRLNKDFKDIDLTKLFKALDQNKHDTIAGSAFYGSIGKTISSFDDIRLYVKDQQGRLVDYETNEIMYNDNKIVEHDYSQHKLISFFPLVAFKMFNLPIYVIILNNQFITNKVLFVEDGDDVAIFAENDSVGRLKDTIFHPTFSDNVKVINDNIITTSAFTLDMYGSKEWDSYNGVQVDGSEIALAEIDKPLINDSLIIDTNMKYEFIANGVIKFKPEKLTSFIKVKIITGPFFEDCVDPKDHFEYNFVVHKG